MISDILKKTADLEEPTVEGIMLFLLGDFQGCVELQEEFARRNEPEMASLVGELIKCRRKSIEAERITNMWFERLEAVEQKENEESGFSIEKARKKYPEFANDEKKYNTAKQIAWKAYKKTFAISEKVASQICEAASKV